jgi:hypothetical protein
MRVLLTWELGLNLRHLNRLLPVAQKLKSEGRIVRAAVRGVQGAAKVLGAAGIPFIQAPHLPRRLPLDHRPTGYAEVLLCQGWGDKSRLWGLTQAWLNIFQLFRPDKLLLDYSPTVSLAVRVANIPTVLVGNGFEPPPLADPLPPFSGFPWATPRKAQESEKIAVGSANAVLRGFKSDPIAALTLIELIEGVTADPLIRNETTAFAKKKANLSCQVPDELVSETLIRGN